MVSVEFVVKVFIILTPKEVVPQSDSSELWRPKYSIFTFFKVG